MKKAISIIAFIILAFNGQSQDFPWPENFYGYPDYDTVHLHWSPPLERAVSHYNVYISAGPNCQWIKIKSTTDTTYSFLWPTFYSYLDIGLTAAYKDPDGESDKSVMTIKMSIDVEYPVQIDFDYINYCYWGWANCIRQGSSTWFLNQNEYYSPTQSAAYKEDSLNSIACLYSPWFYSSENLVPTIEFMCKIPEIDGKSDSLIVSIKGHPYTDVLHSINDWQLLSIPQLPYEGFRIEFKATSGGGGGVYIDDLEVKGSPVGMEKNDPSGSSLSISPNPAGEYLNIKTNTTGTKSCEIHLHSLDGSVLKSVKPILNQNERYRLDLSDVPTGIYFLSLKLEEENHIEKIIKR